MTLRLTQLQNILDGLRACLEDELIRSAANGGPEKPAKIELRPGAAFAPYFSTTEDECKCGVAWVRLAGIEPTADGDTGLPRNAAGMLCGPLTWTATVEIGVQRCPTFGDAHTLPTAAESRGDVARQIADQRAMLNALSCCFGRTQDVTPGEYTPIGPEGFCFGGTWTATMILDDCDDCAPEV